MSQAWRQGKPTVTIVLIACLGGMTPNATVKTVGICQQGSFRCHRICTIRCCFCQKPGISVIGNRFLELCLSL